MPGAPSKGSNDSYLTYFNWSPHSPGHKKWGPLISRLFPPSVHPGSRVREPRWNPSLVGSPKVSCIYTCDNFSFDRRPRTEWSAKGSGLQADKSLRGKQARDLKDLISSSCQDTHSEPNRFQNIFFSPNQKKAIPTWLEVTFTGKWIRLDFLWFIST